MPCGLTRVWTQSLEEAHHLPGRQAGRDRRAELHCEARARRQMPPQLLEHALQQTAKTTRLEEASRHTWISIEAWHRHCDIEKCFPVLTGDSCGSRCSCSDGRGGGAGAAPKSSPIRSAIGSEAGAGAGAAGCGCGGGAAALAGGSAKGSIRPDQETHKVSSRKEQHSHCEMLLRIQKQLDGRALLRTS